MIQTVLNKLKTNLVILPLIRLAYRLKLGTLKKAVKLKSLITFELENRTRLKIQEAKLEGYDEELDSIIKLGIFRMTEPEIFDTGTGDFIFDALPDATRDSYHSLKTAYEKNIEKVTALI